ncbi:C40 family peptidase [Streptomyces sulfonofaciens]|nr:C40 family peptidase [Streptomyces sulfonofaciens]
MTGRLVRGFCTAAVAAGTFVAAGTASALPARAPIAPGPAAGSQESTGVTERRPSPPAGAPGARGQSVDALLTDLQRLYRQAERATDSYHAVQRVLDRQRATVRGLDRRLANARRALHESRVAAGRLARLQYQGSSDISPYVRLLLARDPQHALDQGHMLERMSAARASAVRRIAGHERRNRALAATARHALDAQEQLAKRQKRDRDRIQARLRAVERLLASLGGGHPSEARRTGRPGRSGGPQALLDTALHGSRLPSRGGSVAVRYAMEQVGKPYVWGAAGPDAFDCSGLTSRAWARAGRTIPRTSQQQWSGLPRVPMAELRPGDLVVYYPTATHVALYLGNSMVVQAPRPGERVKVSPVDVNPVLGAVRPDPQAPPLGT